MDQTSLKKNLWAWVEERFPLSQGIFIAILTLTAMFYGQSIAELQQLRFGLPEIVVFFLCWSIFLLLRIIDEHKDYSDDLINHPQRVLQSGRIKLTHLKVIASITILFQVLFIIWIDQGNGIILSAWLLTIGWTFLMSVEFFVPRWLNDNQIIYGLSHMVIIVFILALMAQIGSGSEHDLMWSESSLWLLIMGFSAGCSYELTRKAWGLDEEKNTITSYRAILGTWGVVFAIACTLAVAIIMSQVVINSINPLYSLNGFLLTQIIVWLLTVYALSKYASAPTRNARKVNELFVGLCSLVIYLSPLIAMVQYRGIQ